ncbi:tudor domain-containing protein 5-like isoform X2 [Tribolium madens]|uniref:tudor domain-containing protein 5-like isoform X2 n=1 Tax=Tribolium madens TaxID=41895 RepID=UPI001CF74893|nr:tudor domain-containing protein 5-like isoform X2 [Tribolium madens]
MTSSEATETKCIITSLLTSNPLRSSMKQLCDDFRNIVGYPIPIDKLGFASVEAYLRSIPDTVQVHGSGPYAEVEGVIKAKSAHINLMVAKQKKKPKVSLYKRTRVNFIPSGYRLQQNYTPRRPPRCYTNESNKFDLVEATQTPEKKISPPLDPLNEPCFNIESPADIQDCDYFKQECQGHVVLDCDREIISQVGLKKEPQQKTSSSSESEKEYRILSETSSSLSLAEEKTVDNHSQLLNLNNVAINSDERSEAPSNSNVPTKVENNLKKLILQFPNGLWCSKLPIEYRQMFKKKLNYEYYGYRSLIEMCADLPHVFQYIQPGTHDFLLFDINRSLPSYSKSEKIELEVQVEDVAKTHILDEVELDWTAGPAIIPSDVMRLSDEILRCFPSDKAVGDILEISVEEIYDLSKFWVTLTYGDLESLMNELQTFFYDNHSKYFIPEKLLEVDLFCVALYANLYHRCVIVDLLPRSPGFIRVFFIDYGTVENISSREIWFLPKQFSKVPSQAIRARLSGIYPPYENSTWSEQAIIAFQKLVTNRIIVGEVTKIDETQHVLELYMADITNEKHIFYVNDQLVNEGHAIYIDNKRKKSYIDYDCTPNVLYLHLFPEFSEIESGMAPTKEEMKYIIANKLPLHHYMPQYFNIYYFEDVEQIQTQHEKFNRKKLHDRGVFCEEEDFDFSFFPDILQSEIKDLLEQDTKTKLCGDQLKNDKVPKIGEDELIHGASSKTCSDSKCYRDKSVLTLDSISDVSFSSESSPDILPLNNSFKQLNLNNSDFSVINNNVSDKLQKATNPFLSDDFITDTNPFRIYNPFMSDEDETRSKSDTFNKTPEEKLPDKIVNNLNDISACSCKLNKQVNLDKSNLNPNKSLSNPFTQLEKQQPSNEHQTRVRTPPGFASQNVQNRMVHNSSFINSFNFVNPYYQRFEYPQYNSNFYAQNQFNMSMVQPMGNFLNSAPMFYPNQLNFDAGAWNQMRPQNYNHNPNLNNFQK